MSGRDYLVQFITVTAAIGAVFGVRYLFVRKPKKKRRAKTKK